VSRGGADPPEAGEQLYRCSVEKYAKLGSSAIRAGLERLHKRGRGEE